jgi:hypothetical protein
MADAGADTAVVTVVFGEDQIDVPVGAGATLADVRAAFGFADRGILVVPAADGGKRPVATMPDDEVPELAGVEIEFVVYEDESEREEGAVVQRLLAMGALTALTGDADATDPIATRPYVVAEPAHFAPGFEHYNAYDAWAAPGELSAGSTSAPYKISFAPASVGPRPDVVVVDQERDPWGILATLQSIAGNSG